MKKMLIKIMLFICLLLSLLIFLFHKFIFQEGSPIPIAYSILKLNITKIEYVRVTYNPEKYIFKCNNYEDKGIKTLGNILYNKGPEQDVRYECVFYVVKEQKDSYWLIDTWGY